MCITWIFATFIPLYEAHNEEDQNEKSDSAHQSNKPALSGDVHLTVGYSCTHREGTERRRHRGVSIPVSHNSNPEAVNTEMGF